jgi:hypothetical protein
MRYMTFTLVGFLSLVGLLLHVAALMAYFSNRELMRGSDVNAGPSPGLGKTTEAG